MSGFAKTGMLCLACSAFRVLAAEPLVIHDAHIHYSQDVWDRLPPAQAMGMLRELRIHRVLVSATPGEGAERLYREDPSVVVPLLRPYKNWRHRYVWYKDADLNRYLLEHLDSIPYRGLGEFHINGQEARADALTAMIELARERKLVLFPHADLDAMNIILEQAADLVVIWAHGGFDVPVDTLMAMLDRYPSLYIELSFREGMLDYAGQLTPQWKTFLSDYHTRFLVGADTYLPGRWAELSDLTADIRHWLGQLPDRVAADIARHNFDRLFPR